MPPIGQSQVEIGLLSHDEKGGSGSIVAKTKIWCTEVFVVVDNFCPLVDITVRRASFKGSRVLKDVLCHSVQPSDVSNKYRVSLYWRL